MAADFFIRAAKAHGTQGRFRRSESRPIASKRFDFLGHMAFMTAWLLILLMAALTLGCSSKPKEAWIALTVRGSGDYFKPVSFDVPPFTLAGLLKHNSSSSTALSVSPEGDRPAAIRGVLRPIRAPARPLCL